MTQPHEQRRDLRLAVLRGVAWNGAYQLFSIIVQFSAMLVMVRWIAPADFGRVAVVVGILQLLNTFGCASFMSHALQLPAGEEPDWTLHWHCGLWIQGWLTLGCLGVAAAAHAFPAFRELAPLLSVAAIGLLIDAPSRLRIAQLQRDLDFRRLRLATAVSTLLSVVTSLTLALEGLGALGLILGGNVVVTLGFTLDLLLVARWRPAGPWVRWPDWTRYRPALRFGLFQAGSGVLRVSRGFLAALVLPLTVGYEALGMLGRAEALFTSTMLRVSTLLSETLYPILPQCSDDEARFQRVARAYVAASALILIPGSVFVALEGSRVSRVLYGATWVGADPLIAPQTAAGLLVALTGVAYRLLLARTRLQSSLRIDGVAAVLGAGVVLFTLWHPDPRAYASGLAIAAGASSLIAVAALRQEGLTGSMAGSLFPPAFAAAVGAVSLAPFGDDPEVPSALLLRAAVFFATVAIVLRLVFPSFVVHLLGFLPGSHHAIRLLRLQERHSQAP